MGFMLQDVTSMEKEGHMGRIWKSSGSETHLNEHSSTLLVWFGSIYW